MGKSSQKQAARKIQGTQWLTRRQGGLPNLKWFANRDKGLAAMYASQVTPPGDPQSQALAAKFFGEIWRLYAEQAKAGVNGK